MLSRAKLQEADGSKKEGSQIALFRRESFEGMKEERLEGLTFRCIADGRKRARREFREGRGGMIE